MTKCLSPRLQPCDYLLLGTAKVHAYSRATTMSFRQKTSEDSTQPIKTCADNLAPLPSKDGRFTASITMTNIAMTTTNTNDLQAPIVSRRRTASEVLPEGSCPNDDDCGSEPHDDDNDSRARDDETTQNREKN